MNNREKFNTFFYGVSIGMLICIIITLLLNKGII
jgi:hypothetical protein